MNITAGCRIGATVHQPAELVFAVSVAGSQNLTDEKLQCTVDDAEVPFEEVTDTQGTRMHVIQAPAGEFQLTYDATVHRPGEPDGISGPPTHGISGPPTHPADRILFMRPSRYCQSDTLAQVAGADFRDLTGKDLLDAVSSWVGRRLRYVSGSSRPTDGAVDTYLARAGVCRDFAHLAIALLRARNVPARLPAVYAPGLSPMDFHAVAEAYLDGEWYVLDATTLAPRQSMVRIATGRDASDTAFLTVQSGRCNLGAMEVHAVSDPALPEDDVTELVRLP